MDQEEKKKKEIISFLALSSWLQLCFKLCFKLENIIIFPACIYLSEKKDKLPFYFPSPVFLEACQSACVSELK